MLNWINKFCLQIPETARLSNNLGYYLNHQSDYAEAESFFQKAYSIRSNCYGEEHLDLVHSLNNLALYIKIKNALKMQNLFLQTL